MVAGGVCVAGVEAGLDGVAAVDEAVVDELGLDIAPAADPSDLSISNGVEVATGCRWGTALKLPLIDPLMVFGVDVRRGLGSWRLKPSRRVAQQ